MCQCECGWKVHSNHAISITCARCKSRIECDGPEPNQQQKKNAAIHRDKWPTWATAIAAHAVPGEVGVGDTAKRLIEASQLDTLATIASWLGVPCGCEGRHQQWNKLYKYWQPGPRLEA